MANYLYLFKDDVIQPMDMQAWGTFIDHLIERDHFVGGGPLGDGCTRQGNAPNDAITHSIAGYMVVTADSLEQAVAMLDRCPTIVAGGSVEVRLVPEV